MTHLTELKIIAWMFYECRVYVTGTNGNRIYIRPRSAISQKSLVKLYVATTTARGGEEYLLDKYGVLVNKYLTLR